MSTNKTHHVCEILKHKNNVTYKLIHGDSVLVAQPLLIKHYGRVGASLIQQIYYWSSKGKGVKYNNQRWIHNTLEQWAEQLCVSASTIKRTVQKLLQDGAIHVKKLSPHKSDQTNSYAINLDRLISLATERGKNTDNTTSGDTPAPTQKVYKNRRKAHLVKMTSSSGQNEPLVNRRITYKDNNKSEDVVHSHDGKERKSEAQVTSDEVPQVENRNFPHKEKDSKQEGTNHSNSPDQPASKLPPTLVRDMVNIWNNEVSINKKEVSVKINRAISKYLVACFKYKFNHDLNAWQHYCKLIASSAYLMGKDFVLSLNWVVKFTTIDRILAGELGVKKIERVRTEEEMREDALRHIDGVGESEGCKAIRRMILSALGSAIYVSWFKQVDIMDDGLTLKSHNRFVEDYIKANFGHVFARMGGEK